MNFPRISGLFRKRQTTVFAFYGPSGTGKSHRARFVAQKFRAKALIDDGLLIQGERIIAGKSAKLESSYMGAVRVALFDDKEHRDQVAKAIQSHHIHRLLILGTSEKMIRKITTRLQLPEPSRFITIQEIATEEEMREARRNRQIEGKHVIPVRSHEIRNKKYSRIFVDSVRVAMQKKNWLSKLLKKLPVELPVEEEAGAQKEFEKSIVRPSFSVYARKPISHAVLARLTTRHALEFDPEIRIRKLSVKNGASGYKLTLTADIPFGRQLSEVTRDAKESIVRGIEDDTGGLVEELFIVVDRIIQPKRA